MFTAHLLFWAILHGRHVLLIGQIISAWQPGPAAQYMPVGHSELVMHPLLDGHTELVVQSLNVGQVKLVVQSLPEGQLVPVIQVASVGHVTAVIQPLLVGVPTLVGRKGIGHPEPAGQD